MENKKELDNIKFKENNIKRYFWFVIGLIILSSSYNLFILSNNLVYGGVSGLAVITKDIIDPSLFILTVNLLLLSLSFAFLGKERTIGSISGILLYPLFVKLTSGINNIIFIENTDIMLNILFAGFTTGIASGIIIKNGFSTGGTDIMCQIISKLFKISIGKCFLFIDGVVIVVASFFLGGSSMIIKLMYAIVLVYIHSLITDKIILGISSNKAFFIITDKEDLVKEYILSTLNNGVTVLRAKGGYEGSRKNVLLCVVPAKNYFRLKEGISTIDNEAFFVVTDAYEVQGGA